MNTTERLLALLLQARTVAHLHHWKTRSFSMHVAFNELYELLTKFADELAEMYMGTNDEELNVDPNFNYGFTEHEPLVFIKQLDVALVELKQMLPELPPLINKYEELQGEVSKVKYKLERLK